MADSKLFTLPPEIAVIDVARGIEGFLSDKKKLLSEVVETPNGVIVQARPTESWKKFVGMDNSIQVQLYDQGTNVMINVGSGKWIDKAGAAAIGAFVFAPLAVTAAIGAWATKKLPEEIFDFVERFILSGGRTAAITMNMSTALAATDVLCPKCKTKNPEGTKFCNSCGEKLIVECPQCNAILKPGTKFCNSCGANVAQQLIAAADASSIKCEKCGVVMQEGVKFCAECGAPAPVKLAPGMAMCPSCRKAVPESMKFCPECGGAMPIKVKPICSKCGAEMPDGVKFCPECGNKA